MQSTGSGEFECATVNDSNGTELGRGYCYRDNSGNTQSNIYGLTSPQMHVCAMGYAMDGVHAQRDDFWCCKGQ